MWTDVIDLNAFYRSRMGAQARTLIQRRLRQLWPNTQGDVVVGLGYATPYLKMFREEADRTLAVMPAYQGVTHWPRQEPGLVTLAEETHLPFPDLSVDRLLLVHALENTERMRDMLQECWRVLNGVGRMIVIVPSRRGLWARNERTPFGHGKPFSLAQLERLLRETQFEPGESRRSLYMPPFGSKIWLPLAPTVERIAPRAVPRLGGVIMLDATKQVYAPSSARKVARRKLVVLPGAVGAARAASPRALRHRPDQP